jgi:tRNA(fMet)-specific endonuclease VapC
MPSPHDYLLDTGVAVELLRAKRLGKYIEARFHLLGSLNRCLISVVTVGELFSAARQFGWGAQKLQQLEELLDEIVWVDINHPDILNAYAEVDHYSRTLSIKMGKNDVWIAATAKVSGLVLLTTDTDFDHLHTIPLQRVWIDPKEGKTP